MAGELELTGVQAIVKDVEKYLRDIDRMDAANKRLNSAFDKLAQQQERTGKTATQLLDEYKRSDEIAKAAQRTEEMNKAMSRTGVVMMGAATAMGLMLAKTVQLAGRVQTLGVVVDQLGKLTGATPGQMRLLEKSLQSTGISLVKAREAIARMYQSEIDLAYATDLAREAQNAAVIANIDSSEAFNNLVYGIQSANVRVLRTMGLNVNFMQSYKDLAKEIGKTTNELTAQEKTQARVQAVLAAGIPIQGAYEAAMTTAGKKLLSLNRLFQDGANAIGRTFLPEYTGVIDSVYKSLSAWRDLDRGTQAFRSSMVAGGIASTFLVGGLMKLIPAAGGAAKAMQLLMASMAANPILLVASAAAVLATTVYSLNKAQQAATESAADMAVEYQAQGKTYDEYLADLKASADEQGRLLVTEEEREKARQGLTEANDTYRIMYDSVVAVSQAEYDLARLEVMLGDERREGITRLKQAADYTLIYEGRLRSQAEAAWDVVSSQRAMWDSLKEGTSGLFADVAGAANFAAAGGQAVVSFADQLNQAMQTGAVSVEAAGKIAQAALPADIMAEYARESGATGGEAWRTGLQDALTKEGVDPEYIKSLLGITDQEGINAAIQAVLTNAQQTFIDWTFVPEGTGTAMMQQLLNEAAAVESEVDLMKALGLENLDMSAIGDQFDANVLAPVEAAAAAFDTIQDKEVTVKVNYETEGAPPGFQHGGSFIVRGRPGPDANLVPLRLTRGERVTVTPASQVANTYNQQDMRRSVHIGQQTIGGKDDKVWFDRQMRDWLGG